MNSCRSGRSAGIRRLGAALAVGCCLVTPLRAEVPSVSVSELGGLTLAFARAAALEEISGSTLRGEVRYQAGDSFVVRLPMAAQRIEFLVASGAQLSENDAVVRLTGPDVHHWLISTEAVAQQYLAAEARFTQNRPLFEQNALSAAAWADIQRSYFDLQLENEHREHVLSLTVEHDGGHAEEDGDHGTMTLRTPMAGMVKFDSRMAARAAEEPLFEIIPREALRMQVDVPWRRADDLVALRFGDCRIPVDRIEGSGGGFFLTAWSDSLTGPCYRPPGTVASVTPIYGRRALTVPRSAVFQWEQVPHVFLRQNGKLSAVPVEILGERNGDFLVAGGSFAAGSTVLTESVSAVQGILLGLGSD